MIKKNSQNLYYVLFKNSDELVEINKNSTDFFPHINEELLIYEPEYLTNFEIGMTSSDLATNYRYAIVLFYSERTNQQVSKNTEGY